MVTRSGKGRSGVVRTLLWASVVAVALTTPALSGAAPAASIRFTDFSNDSFVAGGMDIRDVIVSDDNGRFTFRIETPTQPTFPPTHILVIGVNTDRNLGTGTNGFELRIWIAGSNRSVRLDRWTGTAWSDTSDPSLTLTFDQGATTAGVAAASFGVATFDFLVGALGANGTRSDDGAPNQGMWTFDPLQLLTCFGSAPTGPPTEGPDVIVGTSGEDVIDGLGGDDKICGGTGRDFLDGGAGNDQVDGGETDDVLEGGDGDDTIEGGAGFDAVDFHDNPSGVQASLATGKATGDGEDQLSGLEALWGTFYNDVLEGSAEGNAFFPFIGNDVIRGRAGDDRVLFIRTRVTANLKTGRATGEGEDRMASIEGLVVCGAGRLADAPSNVTNCGFGDPGPARLTGNAGDNLLIGGDQRDVIDGGGGDDNIRGLGRNDTLLGGGGADLIEGNLGNDLIDGGPGLRDLVTYLSASGVRVDLRSGKATGDGTDTLRGLETVEGTEQIDRMIGDASRNTLRGAGGDDRLEGLGGDDFLDGGGGTDRTIGGAGRDYCVDGETTPGCEDLRKTSTSGRLAVLPAPATTLLEALAGRDLRTPAAPLDFPRSLGGLGGAANGSHRVTYLDPGCNPTNRGAVTWVDTPRYVEPVDDLAGEQIAEWRGQLRPLGGRPVFVTTKVESAITGDAVRGDGWASEWRDANNRPYRAVRRSIRGTKRHEWLGQVTIVGGPTVTKVVGVCP
jgi:Ca2+-binding RTX toxin-like protein